MSRFLVVDDDPGARYGTRRLLQAAGHEVVEASSGEEGLRSIEGRNFDGVLLDYQMGGMDGLSVLESLGNRPVSPPVVLFTAQGSERIAVEAMRRGAHDYLVKPADPEELVLVLERAASFHRSRTEADRLREELEARRPTRTLLGESAGMKRLFQDLELMAPASASVLLLGESGTGKEMIARRLHELAGRPGPFVAVNCGALPPSLLEAELFGHEKGAFTGALSAKIGKIRQADGGTLFLDEIGDMPIEAQTRLLRVLEEREVEPIGSSRPVEVDIRVVAATHRNLSAMSAEGRFREDLRYRLEVLVVHLPPLRERGEDVLLLARAFLAHFSGARRLEFSPRAEQVLQGHDWPGNVRELRNVVERCSVLARTPQIGPELLGLPTRDASPMQAPPTAPASFSEPAPEGWLALPPVALDTTFREAKAQVVDDFERRFLQAHLDRSGGNVSRAATTLDMHRQSLQQKIRDLGMARLPGDEE
ncbi:MAG: sigma-54-dependent Fis family transcriptional regulator [Fibrobacteria bacterium]|nr:sigma-54-dependent Fis family transcriptional regulator [Fibrobacteria bacterium]